MNAEKSNENDNGIKIILLGESGVGKTNLIHVFMGYKFDINSSANTTNLYSLESEFPYKKKKYKFYMWDTAGQEFYRSINKIFIRNAKIILITYSIIDRKSFEEVDYWINCVKETKEDDKYIIGLVANKSDLFEQQLISDEEGKEKAKKYGIDFIITSACENIDTFKTFVYKLLSNYIETYVDDIGGKKGDIKLNDKKNKNKKKCC